MQIGYKMIEDLLKDSYMLHDLGSIAGKRYEGILSPIYSKNKVNEHIHDQFTVNSSEYIAKYQNTDYWGCLLRTALNEPKINDFNNSIVLDLGSGAGNTVIPILKMFNKSTIIATDISIELLCSLKEFLGSSRENLSRNSYTLIQLDIHELSHIFRDDCFDIIIGGAILHHLYDPQKVLKQCYSVLKQNGVAIFFEPFENGNMLLSLLYQLIIARNNLEKDKIPDAVVNVLNNLCYDFDIRRGINKSEDIFKMMDDKWLFSKNYFQTISDDIGFSSCSISPLANDLKMYFEDQTRTYLRLSIGFEYNKLPFWSKEIIKLADITFSDETKKDLLIEGYLRLVK